MQQLGWLHHLIRQVVLLILRVGLGWLQKLRNSKYTMYNHPTQAVHSLSQLQQNYSSQQREWPYLLRRNGIVLNAMMQYSWLVSILLRERLHSWNQLESRSLLLLRLRRIGDVSNSVTSTELGLSEEVQQISSMMNVGGRYRSGSSRLRRGRSTREPLGYSISIWIQHNTKRIQIVFYHIIFI